MNFKKIIFVIIINFILILNVNASTIAFDSKYSLTINQNESQNVLIKITTENTEVERVEFDLVYNNEAITIKQNDNENGYAQVLNKNTVTILPTGNSINDGTIYSLSITNISSEDAGEVLEINNIKINGETIEGNITKTLTLKKQITTTTKAKNTSAKLTNFTVNNATIKPAFSEDVKEYKIYVNKDTINKITISPSYEQSGTTMDVACTLGCTSDSKVPNKLNLIMGKNEATFTFTSEDGKSTESYTFIIYRGDTTDGSNFLSDLSIEGVTLNETFDKSNLDYTASVSYETESIKVNATGEDEDANIVISGENNLKVGENVITITVTSTESGEKKIYNITVTREEFTPEEDNSTNVVPAIEKEKKNNTWLIIIIALIATLIIGVAAYFIFFRKNDNKNKKKTNNKDVSIKEKTETDNGVSVKETEETEINDNGVIDDKKVSNVDDALEDLMKTKEMEIN